MKSPSMEGGEITRKDLAAYAQAQGMRYVTWNNLARWERR